MQNHSSDSSKRSPVADDSKAGLNSTAAEDVSFSINAADSDDLEALERAEQADQRQEG